MSAGMATQGPQYPLSKENFLNHTRTLEEGTLNPKAYKPSLNPKPYTLKPCKSLLGILFSPPGSPSKDARVVGHRPCSHDHGWAKHLSKMLQV